MAEHYSPVGCHCLVLAFQIPLHSKFKDQGYAEEIYSKTGLGEEGIKIVFIHFFSPLK